MIAQPPPATLSVDQLLDGIKRLPSGALREFRHRFLAWQEANGHSEAPDRLSPAEERRLKRLIARSERALLTPEELAEYRALARRAEQVSAARLQELAALKDQAAPAFAKNPKKKGSTGGS